MPSLMTFNTATSCFTQSMKWYQRVIKLFNTAIPPISPNPINAGMRGMKILAIDFKIVFILLCLRFCWNSRLFCCA